jgi:cytochrome c oxidase subunit 1
MNYQFNATIHNTQFITGHFHLIFPGAIVIMYFAITYDLWPHLTGRALADLGLIRAQLWLWFIGIIVTTFPWHWVGLLGMPRRMAYYDYSSPELSPDAFWVTVSAFGGFILLVSGLLFLLVLIRGQFAEPAEPEPYRFARAVHPPTAVPAALNGFGLWVALMIGLTVTNYGYPILQLAVRPGGAVPAVYIGAQR